MTDADLNNRRREGCNRAPRFLSPDESRHWVPQTIQLGGTNAIVLANAGKQWKSMRLINFDLTTPSFGIELIGLGFVWDLHNFGTFLGVNFCTNDNTAVMRWLIEIQPGADDHPATKYSGCELAFRALNLMIISPRDRSLPLSEDLCISGISKVVPGDTKAEYRTRRHWNAEDPFHLLFEFQSGRSMEIDAETVELIGVIAGQ